MTPRAAAYATTAAWSSTLYTHAAQYGPAADAVDRRRGLTEHEAFCGARLAPCPACRRDVPVKCLADPGCCGGGGGGGGGAEIWVCGVCTFANASAFLD